MHTHTHTHTCRFMFMHLNILSYQFMLHLWLKKSRNLVVEQHLQSHTHLTSAIANKNNLSIAMHNHTYAVKYLNTMNLGHKFIITKKPTSYLLLSHMQCLHKDTQRVTMCDQYNSYINTQLWPAFRVFHYGWLQHINLYGLMLCLERSRL